MIFSFYNASPWFLGLVAATFITNITCATRAAELSGPGASFDVNTSVKYPEHVSVVNVMREPYLAKGDGLTDDTEAIQRALADVMGQHRILYFPNGTYLISKTLNWSKQNSDGKEAWGMNFLQGQNATKTIIRLKSATFTDPAKPASVMWCGGFGSADWFHNYIQDMTFDVGDDNPSAIGLQFYSNNVGAVRNCRIVAGKNSGTIGLDLGHRDMNGPLLVRNCEVIGFQRGIATSRAVNSQTFEHITIRNQKQFGFDNEGQVISIHGLLSENAVPAVRSYGTFTLLDSSLKGLIGANQFPAMINYNGGRIFARDVETTGYARAIGDVKTPDWYAAVRITGQDRLGSEGPTITEYCSHEATSPFGSNFGSLRLPIKETPDIEPDDLTTWAVVDDFGADPTGKMDSSFAIQKAIDSGATTVFLPGFYNLTQPVRIRAKVRRFLGAGAWIDHNSNSKPDLIVDNGDAKVVAIEHIFGINGGVQISTSRAVVLRSLGTRVIDCRMHGDLFFEDVTTDNLQINSAQSVWARQLNVENEGTHITNNGGKFWALGYKTERGGTLVVTRDGGQSEILGGFSYTTTAGKLAPMFVTENSAVFTYFAEVCYTGDPFTTIVRETENGDTKFIDRSQGSAAPYSSKYRRRGE